MKTSKSQSLEAIAKALVAPGKGILAADESFPTIEKRFKSIQLPSTEENRREYRDMLFNAPGLSEYISGVILFDETMRQQSVDGRAFPELLAGHNMIPGIKVDKGTRLLPGFPGEKITEGLDSLSQHLPEYKHLGAQFTKWRAVFHIGPHTPSRGAIEANAHALAQFAAMSQAAGLVPIVEPEVLMDGDHSIERHQQATEEALRALFRVVPEYHVRLEEMLLKTNMVLSGVDCREQAGASQAADMTLQCMLRVVPAAVPGIVFLSGGQTETQSTTHLRILNQLGPAPWPLSFSFGRALQASALKTWRGAIENVGLAQQALLYRARCNHAALFGKLPEELEHLVDEVLAA